MTMLAILSEVSEGLYAAVVRALIMAAQAVIPGAKEWLETSKWKNAAVFGACMLVPIILWTIVCPLDWADIPGYEPRCNMEGILLDVVYQGFMAFALNFVGEYAFKWVRDKCTSGIAALATRWLGSFWFWVFVGTVVMEFFLSRSTMDWQLSLGISVGVSIVATLVGRMFFPSVRALGLCVQSKVGELIWWAAMVVKIIIHLLPLPMFIKPFLSIGLTLLIFLLANFIFGVGL